MAGTIAMQNERPSYQRELKSRPAPSSGPDYDWSNHAATTAKPRRSSLKKPSSSALLDCEDTRTIDAPSRGHSQPNIVDKAKPRAQSRRPSKTIELDPNDDVASRTTRSTSSSSLSLLGLSSSGPSVSSSSLRRYRRRSSRQKQSSIEDAQTPLKGILRTSSLRSMPSNPPPRKHVSWSGLDNCRWHSQGSSLNLTSQAIKPTSELKGAAKGNFVWSKKKGTAPARSTARSYSETNISRIITLELKHQAPNRPKRRGSNESEAPARQKNVFQAAVEDFQASVRSGTRAGSGHAQMPPPSAPGPRPSRHIERDLGSLPSLLGYHGVIQPKSTGSNARAPKMPSRRGSSDFEDESECEDCNETCAMRMPVRSVNMEHGKNLDSEAKGFRLCKAQSQPTLRASLSRRKMTKKRNTLFPSLSNLEKDSGVALFKRKTFQAEASELAPSMSESLRAPNAAVEVSHSPTAA